jgi:hypothetical protein
MRRVPIEEMAIDDLNTLVVRPKLGAHEDFRCIYRAALGVRWLPETRSLAPIAGSSPTHVEWLRRILRATRDEYGCELVVSAETRWLNVPVDLRKSLEAATREAVA